MDYDQIERDFVTRTLELLKNYTGDFEVTLLINCCLGLIVLPKEKHYNSIPETEIPLAGSLWGLSQQNVTVDCASCGYSLKEVLRRIRNGICHFKIKTIPDGSGNITTLEIKDRGKFKAVLSCDELRQLADSLSKHILKT